ncbi:NAD-dependent 4,6-dehydratase LegB [Prochlorococcus sp. MIT 1307]|uniref:NAD-dependent 4,6-dehydratase LegB n=1 Tax=Prochlorococcus sp. MIT 1307 TaxID=3096219 RepID=UPI002A766144|nr:NAD-dependent 4,6-dehydratase LegB [Prochlorococcus sp. MIT 1307]
MLTNKKVLVTGADGFIGSHLVEKLLSHGYDVRAFCLYNSNGSWGWLDTIPSSITDSIEIILGDIRDYASIKNAMINCEHVYHLASLIAIPYSYIAPSSYIDTNITGTLNVLQAARELSTARVIHTSTSETYGTAKFVPITEDHPLSAQSPYAASKIGADQLAISYWKSFETPVSILRPFNTYGPRQSSRAVIPTIITQIASGQNKVKLGALSPTRDFNYVTDTCAAFMAVANSENTLGQVINSASSFEISIGETASLISKCMDKDIEIISDEERMRPIDSEVNRLYGDNSLLKRLTSWEPEYGGIEGFTRGINSTIEWFSKPSNLSKYRVGSYMI